MRVERKNERPRIGSVKFGACIEYNGNPCVIVKAYDAKMCKIVDLTDGMMYGIDPHYEVNELDAKVVIE